MHPFLSEMKQKEVPIDFFSLHFYSNNATTGARRAREIQTIPDQYGYGNAESICVTLAPNSVTFLLCNDESLFAE